MLMLSGQSMKTNIVVKLNQSDKKYQLGHIFLNNYYL
jgi:hypothetical protein